MTSIQAAQVTKVALVVEGMATSGGIPPEAIAKMKVSVLRDSKKKTNK